MEKARGKRPEGYSRGEDDYTRLLARDDLDGVIICTPWQWHGPMAIATLKAGKYAGLETPGLINLEDCLEVVRVSAQTGAVHVAGERVLRAA